ncbi:MAG: sigma 54-interacting transcriptional regulator [Nitrospinae bacterium]|nr:sigma 54-interacting transcriptional regulator [Nitrospinota bacterium]
MNYPTRLILDSAGEGIYGLDSEGYTTFVNPAAQRMTGYTEEEMIGTCQHKMVHHSRPDGTPYSHLDCPIYAAFKDGKVYSISNEVFWRKDGTSFPVEYTSTPIIKNGKCLGAVVVFNDISKRKKDEEEIIKLKRQLELENAYLNQEILEAKSYGEIIGRSPALRAILSQIELVAPTEANVLITGESGTGKELIAREIHNRSSRKKRTLIKVNCASIPKELYESEFFGHIKGAFTGATRDRAGRFEMADGGTLFLDEIGEIPLELQSKLLRVLQESAYEKVGDDKTRRVDVRIIVATNRNLKEESQAGRFRQDLFYRLNVFPIEAPPLRERMEDIPALADHFLRSATKKLNVPEPRLTQANIQDLQAYDWPGNIRELQNVIDRAVILSKGRKLLLNLPTSPNKKYPSPVALDEGVVFTDEEMKARESLNLISALKRCKGKVTGPSGAAELLKMNPTTLYSRIKKLNLKA